MEALAARLQDITVEANTSPIVGLESVELVPLEEAVRRWQVGDPQLATSAHTLDMCVETAEFAAEMVLQEDPAERLPKDQIAAIHLYTQESPVYKVLNELLRSRNRELLKPAFAYLKLLLTAIYSLPPVEDALVVFRGIKLNLSGKFKRGSLHMWWALSSTTSMISVLEDEQFLGKNGERTMLNIMHPTVYDIKKYSAIQRESELIIAPGARLEVVDLVNPAEGLYIVHMKQRQPYKPIFPAPVRPQAMPLASARAEIASSPEGGAAASPLQSSVAVTSGKDKSLTAAPPLVSSAPAFSPAGGAAAAAPLTSSSSPLTSSASSGVPTGGVGMGPMPGVNAMGAGPFYQPFPPAPYPGATPGMAATGYPAPSVPTFGGGAALPMMPSVPPMYPAGGGAAGIGASAQGAPHPGMGAPPQGARHPGMAGSGMGTASPMESVSQSRDMPTLAASNFKALYDAAEPPDAHYELFHMVHQLLTAYCATHGIDPRCGDSFFRRLEQEAFSASISTTELLTKVELAAQRLWTSALRMEGAGVEHEKELCAIINHSIRNDANLDMLRPAVVLVRSINQLCVARRKDTPVYPPEFVWYRGSSLPDECRSFFTVGRKYRVPGYLATSTSEGVAFEFLYREHQDTQRPVVLWRVHLDKRFRHRHVIFVTNPHVRGEDELLFVPYSVFTVQSVEWRQGDDRNPHVIDLDVTIDNRDDPQDLPTAPWF